MVTFREEECQWLSLGFAPLAPCDELASGCNRLSRWFAQFVRTTGNGVYQRFTGRQLYSFDGLAQHKSKYRGLSTPVFFASRSHFQLHEIAGIFKVCNVL